MTVFVNLIEKPASGRFCDPAWKWIHKVPSRDWMSKKLIEPELSVRTPAVLLMALPNISFGSRAVDAEMLTSMLDFESFVPFQSLGLFHGILGRFVSKSYKSCFLIRFFLELYRLIRLL